MANQWMETLLSLVDASAVRGLAGQLGESPDAVKKGLEGSALAMLLSLANRAGDTGFLTTIFNLLKNPAVSADALSNAGSLLGGGSALSGLATQFLGSLFGDKQSAVASSIAQSSGLKSSSASSLLSAAAPLVLAFLNKQNGSAGVSGLAAALLAQKSGLQNLLPAGLAGLLGGGLPSLPEGNPSAAKWILPALLAAAALFGFWWFNQQKPVEKAAQETKEVATKAVESTSNALTAAWAALGELFARKLPNGVELNIPKLGVENRLIDFIADAAKPVDKTTWFDFDRLLFQRASVFIAPSHLKNYTMQADVLTEGNVRSKSDIGFIHQRYLICLRGNAGKLEVSSNLLYTRSWYGIPSWWRLDLRMGGPGTLPHRV